ncbi:NAD(P)H-binding protein [Streptomyces sp. NPDC059740]|uniref:NAD(P)H-binding protein n=1 Tax=Streptomyces sp. NPDC059740 TaxID=3346926 RepID=UPI003664395E
MIVITGATGNIGRVLVERLLERGAPVRALTRDPDRAGLPSGAEVVRADLNDPASLAPALRGATALYLNLAAGGAQGGVAAVEAARAAGVGRIVLNSSISVVEEGPDSDSFIARMHADVEQAVREAGVEWMFVRGGMYATNALGWAPGVRAGSVVRGPYPDAVGAPVHEADLAEVAAVGLLDGTGEHLHTAPVVTGPEAVTVAEQVAAVGRALGREVRFEQISVDEAAAEMAGPHFPEQAARTLLDYFRQTVGTKPVITDEVRRITGRPARTFEEWARDHAADFR